MALLWIYRTMICSSGFELLGDMGMNFVRLLLTTYTIALGYRVVLCCRSGEYEINGLCCPMCPSGTVVKTHCSANVSSIHCKPCVEGTYMDQPNGETECRRCTECDTGAGLEVKQACTSESNTVCQCKPGYFCENECDLCMKHKICSTGEFLKAAGTLRKDTTCEPCPNGTFSSEEMAETCTPWTECSYVSMEGTATLDSICGRSHVYVIASIAILCTMILLFSVQSLRTGKRQKETMNKPVQEEGQPVEQDTNTQMGLLSLVTGTVN